MWSFCRDVINGSDSIKDPITRTRYLPQPEGMSTKEYEGYVARAEFCPFATRTAEGTHGLCFQKPLVIDIPDSLKPYLDNIDGKGNDINKFTNDLTWDCMITGFGGVLLDAPEGQDLSLADAERNGIYPYCTFYQAEKIINVQTKTIGRREVVTMIVLAEKQEVDTGDRYTKDLKDRYRVLELDEEGYYLESVYDEHETIISQVYPKKFGQRLTYIPFYFLPNRQPTMPMFKPVCDVNVSWYHKSADLENGLHWTGVPTPYCIGYEPELVTNEQTGQLEPINKLKLGGSQFIYFPMGVTQVGYLEFGGAGLSQLQTALATDEDRMAILGARIISQERKGVESAETARIHRAGENSVIATFTNEISGVLSDLLRDYLEWSIGREIPEDISVKINTDYDISRMTPAELTALVALWQSGGISKEVMFNNLKEGEIIHDDLTFEEHEDKINAEREQQMVQNAQQVALMTQAESAGA